MNKLKAILTIALLVAASQLAHAQFTITVAGAANRYLGPVPRGEYPVLDPQQFPTLVGLKVGGSFGFPYRNTKNSINLHYGYYFPTGTIDVNYGGVTMRPQTMELELNYHRYFVGVYNFDEFKFYGILGFSGILMDHRYTVPDPALINPGEIKFFRNTIIQAGYYNVGLGVEIPTPAGIMLFLEAKASIHGNVFFRHTTIWESSLNYFGSGTFGLRFPITGREKGRHPRRK
jgi:hypothetical protein